jgi:allophanate hydrolase
MPNTYSLDFARLAAAYAEGTLTPATVVHDVYRTIEADRANPIWIHVRPLAEVEAQARALEAQHAAGARLPLYGVPFAVKDNIDVAGCPTTAACPAFSYMPKVTAYAVLRLQEAGALLIGKTNLDQFATGLVGTRSPYGACFNSFDKAYIAGGSSSGSALAVATGAVSFALGTDTAGSGRVPAAYNNIVGLKPTRGRVSTHGVVPACRSLDCVSVFALTCEDAYAVFELMRGFDPEDIFSRTAREMDDGTEDMSRFRCGIPDGAQLEFFGDTVAREAFERAREALSRAGADIVEVDFRPFAEAARLLYEGPWVAERFAALKDFMREHAADMHPVTRDVIAAAGRWSAVDAFEAFYRLRELKRHCEREWAKMDVLAVPSAGTIYTLEQIAAAPVEHNTRLGYYTNFVNLMDLAALAVPGAFRADGLPAGVTLIAPADRDRLLAALGERVHRASGVRLGATGFGLPALSDRAQRGKSGDVVLAVAGAHLAGLPLNHQLTARNARLLETTKTAAHYRLYALPGAEPQRPGLVRVGNDNGAAIEVELWSVPLAAFGSFVAAVPPPLAIGTITLADGREVKGFICETCAVAAAQDISVWGGWRAYLARPPRSES